MPDRLLYINSQTGLQVYCLLTKNKGLKGFIPVLGQHQKNKKIKLQNAFSIADITSAIINNKGFKEVWVMSPSGDYNSSIKDLLKLERLGLSLKIVPEVNQWSTLDLRHTEATHFSVNTIIKYQSYEPDNTTFYRGKTILITGAGGSIGGVLAMLASQKDCAKLVLIDHSESAMHQLKLNLLQNGSEIHFLIADVKDKNRLQAIFHEHKPDVIFHLAAYKHVGLMEENASEAFKVNVLGTRNLYELSKEHQTSQFNFISTDKAVKPVCIMGLTKKLAEDYLLNTQDSKVKINILRFGNVLGSSGSVVKSFKTAIDNYRPLEIKDLRMKRYFIIDEDAAKFIWHAPLQANNKDTLVFYIKEATAIKGLAKSMLLLNGIADHERKIVELHSNSKFEKLSEQLFEKDQPILDTPNKLVKVIPKPISDSNIIEKINKLRSQLDEDTAGPSFSELKVMFTNKVVVNR